MAGEFKTTLLREKFVMSENGPAALKSEPVIALSNRIVLNLAGSPKEQPETYIIRSQNMHSCARLAAAIAKEYTERGAIMKRVIPFYWRNLWLDAIKGYEKDWNPDIWGAIYYKGRVIFDHGEHHPFLDIIEKCDAANQEDYTKSVAFAEDAFRQAGKDVTIKQDSNIALIVTMKDDVAQCGIILRGAGKKATFNLIVKPRPNGEAIRFPTIMTTSALFLEGIQLAFAVGFANRKREMGMVDRYSDEDRKARRGAERLANLSGAINTIEEKYQITYRPERPDFQRMVRESDEHAGKILAEAEEDSE